MDQVHPKPAEQAYLSVSAGQATKSAVFLKGTKESGLRLSQLCLEPDMHSLSPLNQADTLPFLPQHCHTEPATN